MPWQDVPGARGVRQRPTSETMADPDYEWIELPDGTIRARRKAGLFTKALPYIVGAGMAAPHLAALMGVGSGAAAGAGGGQAASGAGGLLPSYGASPAIQAAGMGLPSASMTTPAAAMAGLGGSNGSALSRIFGGGGGLSDVLRGLRDYGPLALAGLSAGRGLTQGQTDAERQLNEILNMAKGRITATEPLFNQLNTMAQAQMPRYTREGG